MTETKWDDLPMPPNKRRFRMEDEQLYYMKEVSWLNLSRVATFYAHRKPGDMPILEDVCALAEVAFRREAEQLQDALDAACATDNADGSMNCSNCPCDCTCYGPGQEVYDTAQDDMERFAGPARAWRAAGDAVREEQDNADKTDNAPAVPSQE